MAMEPLPLPVHLPLRGLSVTLTKSADGTKWVNINDSLITLTVGAKGEVVFRGPIISRGKAL